MAILGVSKSAMEPVWNGKEFVPRLMLPISLSFDHRVIDGADGARFITIINNTLSDIRRLGDVIEKAGLTAGFFLITSGCWGLSATKDKIVCRLLFKNC